MLSFPCVKCGQAIEVKYLHVGEQALCRSCGTYQTVPDDSRQIDGEPRYDVTPAGTDTPMAPEPSEVDVGPPDMELIGAVKEGMIDYQKDTAGGLRSLIWLVVSIVFFMAIASFGWTLESLLIIVVVILVHEMGHVVGMRIFGYKNVRMLFIPMLGAAVSGRQTSADTRHAVFVSLLGPIPGILIGIGVGVLSLQTKSELLMKYAFASILVNIFNLLPIMPLDGGRVLKDSLFSRYPRGEQTAAIVGAVLMVLVALLMESPILGLVSVFTLASAFGAAAHESRIVAGLHQSRRYEKDYDNELPSIEFIRAATSLVSQHVRNAYRKPRLITQIVVGAWNQMRRKPMRPLHSAGLLATGFIFFAVGLGSLMVFIAASFYHGYSFVPGSPLQRAYALYKSGDYDHFLAACDSLPPEIQADPLIRTFRGNTYIAKRQFEPALAELQAAYGDDSMSYNIHHGLSVAYKATGQYDRALVHYLWCIEAAPDIPLVRSDAMVSALAIGDTTLALQQAEMYRELIPDDPVAVASLALIHHALGHTDMRDSLVKVVNIMGYGKMDRLVWYIESGGPLTPMVFDSL